MFYKSASYEMSNIFLCTYLSIFFLVISTANGQLSNNHRGDALSETVLHPIPNEMTFEEYKDMNRRMSQALLWSSIPVPGITHYYAGEIKKSKNLFYIGLGGLTCVLAGISFLEEGSWPKKNDNYVILNEGTSNEQWYEKIPIKMEGELIHYNLRKINKENADKGGGLIFIGLAIIIGDFVYDRVKGVQLIEEKRDRVRFKYGKKLKFLLDPKIDIQQNNLGISLNFSFG